MQVLLYTALAIASLSSLIALFVGKAYIGTNSMADPLFPHMAPRPSVEPPPEIEQKWEPFTSPIYDPYLTESMPEEEKARLPEVGHSWKNGENASSWGRRWDEVWRRSKAAEGESEGGYDSGEATLMSSEAEL